jgi:hypothetical protein
MVDRRNRIRFALLGLLLLAAGVAGALVSFDRLAAVDAATPLLPDSAVGRWAQAATWRLPALAAIGLLLVVYGWRVLRAQLLRGGGRSDIGDLDLSDRDRAGTPTVGGRTIVRGAGLAHSLEADLERISGVGRALVGLFGSPRQPDVRAQLDVSGEANLRRVREQVTRTLERLGTTTGSAPRSTTITFRIIQAHTRRVQ